jgi:hypothetical protein
MSYAMHAPKRIEFEYNLDNNNREIIDDHEGTMPCYQTHDILTRGGKSWRVTQVLIQQSDSGPNTLPTLYVSLTDLV